MLCCSPEFGPKTHPDTEVRQRLLIAQVMKPRRNMIRQSKSFRASESLINDILITSHGVGGKVGMIYN